MKYQTLIYSIIIGTGILGCSKRPIDNIPTTILPNRNQNDNQQRANQPTPQDIATTDLMQRAIARVLGFVDIDGKPITVYQDAQSTLYQESGPLANPLFYHAPFFAMGKAKIVPLEDGNIHISVENKYRPDAIKQNIYNTLKETLQDYSIEPNRIGIIPMDNLKAQCRAFNKSYAAEITKDLTNIGFNVPAKDIPEVTLKKIREGTITRDEIIAQLDTCPLEYTYYIQRYKSDACQVQINENDVKNLYMDQGNCPALPEPEVTPEELASLNDAWSNINDTLNKVSQPITACLAGNEANRIMRKASLNCTSASSGNGSIADSLQSFLDQSLDEALSVQPESLNTEDWSDQIAAAAVTMFGSPEKFRTELATLNDDILNKTDTTLDQQEYDRIYEFADRIDQFGRSRDTQRSLHTKDLQQEANSKGGGSGFGFSVGGFGLNFGGSDSTANSNGDFKERQEFERDIDNIRSFMHDTDETEKETVIKNYLRDRGVDSHVANVDGKIHIYPRLNIYARADVNKVRDLASGLSTNNVGEIIAENEEISIALRETVELKIEGVIHCQEGVRAVFDHPIRETNWQDSQTFWDSVSTSVTSVIEHLGCREIEIQLYYSGIKTNEEFVNRAKNINVLVEAHPDSGDAFKHNWNLVFRLTNESTISNRSTDGTQSPAPEGYRIKSIKFLN